MNYDLKFLPVIEEDISSAYNWYESKSSGLGDEFVRLFYALSLDISRNPFRFVKVHEEFWGYFIVRAILDS